MTILVNPYRHRLGADTAVGRLLGDEPSGVAVDFTTMTALIRDDASPLTTYFGNAASLLTYTSPFTKYVCNAAGIFEAGTTLRINHDLATHTPLGLLVETGRSNLAIRNRDLANASWIKTNVTALKDQIGIDGVAASASSIAATAANGTCLLTITSGSAARFLTAYVKRLTGSGTVDMTLDNGTTWVTVTVTADWTRVSIPSQTLTNPTVGFRIATSGDKIAVDFVQCENGTFATSPIATTTALVTRVADFVTLPIAAFPFNAAAATLFAAGVLFGQPAGAASYGASLGDGTTANRMNVIMANNGSIQSGCSLTNASVLQVSFSNMGAVAVGSEMRAAFAAQSNSSAGVSNGGAALQFDNAVIMPVGIAALYFGGSQAGNEHINGHIKRVKYLPRRASNAELQAMVA